MLKFFLVAILYLTPAFMFAQKSGSITIISDVSVPLIFYVDNVKQNDSAVSNIRFEGLTDMYYRVTGVNKDTAYIDRYLLVAGYDEKLVDATYRVRRLNTGKTRVSLYAMLPTNPDFSAPKNLFVTNIKLAGENRVAILPLNLPEADTFKLPQQKAKSLNSESKKESKTVKENKNVKTDKKINSVTQKTSDSISIAKNNQAPNKSEAKVKPQIKNKVPLKSCNGWPITKKDFDLLKKTLMESKTETIKLKNAKSLITGSCFLVNQLDEIVDLLKTEESKLDFVKFAYSFTIDRPNYNRLEKYFTTSKNKEEFSMIHGD